MEMLDVKEGKTENRKVKGRGAREEGERDDRYHGEAGVFESLQEDAEAASDLSGPLKCELI